MRVFGRGARRRGDPFRAGGDRHPTGDTIAFRRVPTDDRGRPTGGPAEVLEVAGCTIERRATIEQSRSVGGVPTEDQRETIITSVLVHTPPGSGADINDGVWLPGERRDARPMWRHMSRPWIARSPFSGAYPGDILELERTDG